jgi:hypothetical protein
MTCRRIKSVPYLDKVIFWRSGTLQSIPAAVLFLHDHSRIRHTVDHQKSKQYTQERRFKNENPDAVVKIHNTDPTPLHSLLRIVLAREAVFCGPSTFCSAAT